MKGTVYIVDDDEAMRDAIALLLESVDQDYESFESGVDFLARVRADWSGCVVLDIRMPQLSGMDVQKRMKDAGIELPIIFVTGHADVPIAVQAMRDGAVGVVQKPLRDQELLDYVNEALKHDAARRQEASRSQALECKLGALTPREREVLDHVMEGKASKVIAFDLDVSQRTVETHRTNIMRKLGVRSVAELFNVLRAG